MSGTHRGMGQVHRRHPGRSSWCTCKDVQLQTRVSATRSCCESSDKLADKPGLRYPKQRDNNCLFEKKSHPVGGLGNTRKVDFRKATKETCASFVRQHRKANLGFLGDLVLDISASLSSLSPAVGGKDTGKQRIAVAVRVTGSIIIFFHSKR